MYICIACLGINKYCLNQPTWVASALIEEFMADLLPAGSNVDLITASRQDETLATVRGGFSQNPLRHGRIVLDSLRNCAVVLADTSREFVH